MDIRSLALEPFWTYDEHELRAGGLLNAAHGCLVGSGTDAQVFETPFCQDLVTRLERRLDGRVVPLTNALYCMLRVDRASTESYWHVDVEEWAFDNTYNIWLPLLFLDANVDGLEIVDSPAVRRLVADGYVGFDELDDHMFRDEIVELESLPHTRYYIQYDASYDYQLWSKDDLEPRYVRPRPMGAELLNAHVFHRTSQSLTARIMWGFKFTLEDTGLSTLTRVPNERAAIWRFYRKHLYESPLEFQRSVFRKIDRRLEERRAHARTLYAAQATFDDARRRVMPALTEWMTGCGSRDTVSARLREASDSVAGFPRFRADGARGFRPFT